jgi:hypothetical protein
MSELMALSVGTSEPALTDPQIGRDFVSKTLASLAPLAFPLVSLLLCAPSTAYTQNLPKYRSDTSLKSITPDVPAQRIPPDGCIPETIGHL